MTNIPYQCLPLWAMISIERLDADSTLRTDDMLDELLSGYAASYGLAVDEETREMALQICKQRFGSSFSCLKTSCKHVNSEDDQLAASPSSMLPTAPSSEELQRHVEPLLAMSIEHLSPQTREALVSDALSIPAYPNDYGGFIHVGMSIPAEPELAAIFEAVRRIDIVWIKFDIDADRVEGLPTFDS